MDKLNESLKAKAVALGLCEKWKEMWNESFDVDKLASMMYKGIDFCIQKRYPSKSFLLENFKLDELRRNNVFVNDKRSTNNPEYSLVLGLSDVKYRYNGHSVGNVYVLDKSIARITAKNRSFVIVHVFDTSVINAETEDDAKIVVISHSKGASISHNGNVEIKEESDYLKD